MNAYGNLCLRSFLMLCWCVSSMFRHRLSLWVLRLTLCCFIVGLLLSWSYLLAWRSLLRGITLQQVTSSCVLYVQGRLLVLNQILLWGSVICNDFLMRTVLYPNKHEAKFHCLFSSRKNPGSLPCDSTGVNLYPSLAHTAGLYCFR